MLNIQNLKRFNIQPGTMNFEVKKNVQYSTWNNEYSGLKIKLKTQ